MAISWLYGRGEGIREAVPAVLLASLMRGAGQLALVAVLPTPANSLPGAITVAVTVWLGGSRWYEWPSPVKASEITGEGERESRGGRSRSGCRLPPPLGTPSWCPWKAA